MACPIPTADEAAISRAFELRGQTVGHLRKKWFGGPWRYFSARIPIPYQDGRPYLAIISAPEDGTRYAVAVDGTDVRGDPTVLLRTDSGWSQISRLRPAITPLVLGEPDSP
jgi:hypothetical protein